ncbi:class I SAM-dependent methyltransferase [Streptomyces litchfieldiae]|uniref:Class I SAM-dependent methyltransferase n=1 Tax=Streptomyces litchfieldiae TaxID=3075543 RepID=A0ABU2MX89_9ACTN|nr:class I SAM-dependent methyltransferase [Streptomyces sp. DSM 44938]MDT0345898.1 class I SAM-dependent methyltransferase [Streptomyces sp. DSM 44938]
MDADVWNEHVARGYDESSTHMYEATVLDPAVDFLARRAGRGPALEFAIGTGRVALPLSRRGIAVAGLEKSEPMARELRKKPGAEEIAVTIGDMAETRAPGEFSLVYVVYNAITCLLSQDKQVACFRNAARHLEPGGRFVIECFIPELQRLPPGETARPFHVGEHHLGFDTFDLANQRLVSHHYRIVDGKADTFLSPHRFVWPSELDLMAKLAGMALSERWADWKETPFTSSSTSHVSVWRKPLEDSSSD